MANYAKYENERQAIAAARQTAIDESNDREDGLGLARVILACGDTLTITAVHGRGVKYARSPGWVRSGTLFCGPRAHAVGVM